MIEAVTNATVLILLSKINRLDLLKVFKTIYSTIEIRNEVLKLKNMPLKGKNLEEFFENNIKLSNSQKKLSLNLGLGEISAISLCKEKNIGFFLSDDKKARRTAQILSIKCIGTLGIILMNLKNKNIKKNEAKEILELLMLNSYYLSSDIYAKMMKLIENFE